MPAYISIPFWVLLLTQITFIVLQSVGTIQWNMVFVLSPILAPIAIFIVVAGAISLVFFTKLFIAGSRGEF